MATNKTRKIGSRKRGKLKHLETKILINSEKISIKNHFQPKKFFKKQFTTIISFLPQKIIFERERVEKSRRRRPSLPRSQSSAISTTNYQESERGQNPNKYSQDHQQLSLDNYTPKN